MPKVCSSCCNFLRVGPQKDKIVLRVSLPTGIYRTMAFQPQQKMHAVLTGVCAKSKLDPTEHLLFYEDSMVSRDLTVSDIATAELKLVERSSMPINGVTFLC